MEHIHFPHLFQPPHFPGNILGVNEWYILFLSNDFSFWAEPSTTIQQKEKNALILLLLMHVICHKALISYNMTNQGYWVRFSFLLGGAGPGPRKYFDSGSELSILTTRASAPNPWSWKTLHYYGVDFGPEKALQFGFDFDWNENITASRLRFRTKCSDSATPAPALRPCGKQKSIIFSIICILSKYFISMVFKSSLMNTSASLHVVCFSSQIMVIVVFTDFLITKSP